MTHASISWRLRFSLVTDVEYTLTAMPQLQRKERQGQLLGALCCSWVQRREGAGGSLEKREASSSRLAAYLLEKGYLLTLEHLVITYYKISWRREWQPILVFLCGESYKQRSLAGYSPGGHRVRHDGAHTHTIQGACVCSAVSDCPWNFPGKNTGVGCHSLLYKIFRTQELNLRLSCLLHWQADSLPLCCYSVAQLCPTLCNPISFNILGT